MNDNPHPTPLPKGEGYSLSDMRIRFEAAHGEVTMVHVDSNGNRISLGELTEVGAIRLVDRLQKLFGLKNKEDENGKEDSGN